jgi:hypothetical protein
MTQTGTQSPGAVRDRPFARGHWREALLCLMFALSLLSLASQSAMALQDDPCAGFSWNVAHERALFATAPESLTAGRDATSTPVLMPDRLYELRLGSQSQVALLVPPGKKVIPEGSFAGMARLRLQAETYRVSVDQSLWIDVVADGRMIESADFQGRAGCLAPHKIVQYSLPAGQELLLQLSAGVGPRARLTITRADAGPTTPRP